MNRYNDFVAQIKLKTGSIILFGIMIGSLSFLFVVLNERNYTVRTDYLVIQNSQNTTDTYALAKSAEYMGKILSEAIRSELFINEVVKTGKVNQEFLPFDRREKLKSWDRTLKINQNANLGIISVSIFDDNQRKAVGISEAISEVMTTKNNLFRGESQSIEVRILSGPVVEKNPGLSKMIAAVIAGFIFGIMISLLWIFHKSTDELEKYRSKIVFNELHGHGKKDYERYTAASEDEGYFESLDNPQR